MRKQMKNEQKQNASAFWKSQQPQRRLQGTVTVTATSIAHNIALPTSGFAFWATHMCCIFCYSRIIHRRAACTLCCSRSGLGRRRRQRYVARPVSNPIRQRTERWQGFNGVQGNRDWLLLLLQLAFLRSLHFDTDSALHFQSSPHFLLGHGSACRSITICVAVQSSLAVYCMMVMG